VRLTMAEVRADEGASGLTVASLFAGGGGSSIGYRLAGYRVLYACEFDPDATRQFPAEAYALNASSGTFLDVRDVREVTGAEIVERCGGVPDVLDMSPPCQEWSTAGKRRFGEKAGLYKGAGVRLVGEVMPRAFVSENVTGFVKGKARLLGFKPILAELRALGYHVRAPVLDASWLGVPQERLRPVLIGLREDVGSEADLAAALPRKAARRTVIRDAMPEVARFVKIAAPCKKIDHYVLREEDTRPASRPAPTVSVTGLGYSVPTWWEVETQDGGLRELQADDARALQCFPSDYKLPEGLTFDKQWHVYSNAVPPPMTRAVGEGLARVLQPSSDA
jgi:DNA (cytosine-5)-methyltransferase 1